MLLRAFAITLTVALAVTVGVLIGVPVADAGAGDTVRSSILVVASPDQTIPTEDTTYEYFPDQRPISDCLSSVPKPNCGSEARGGWRQMTVLGAILAGLAFIAWRIVHQSRKARADRDPR